MALQEEETLHDHHCHYQHRDVSLSLEGLYCEEDAFGEDPADNAGEGVKESINEAKDSTFPLSLLEQDLFWEDEELGSLVFRETESHPCYDKLISDGSLATTRKEAVGWILRIHGHYGFRTLTAVLAINYFDRFILSRIYPIDKPWISQLAAVASLSVAAKMEETQVPLLLELQVEDSKYVFEAKTIQTMELLLMSTLCWRMNLVTPISFFDHFVRRFRLTSSSHRRFIGRCDQLLLSLIADLRLASFLPSVVATATILYVNKEIEQCICEEFLDQLMCVLKINEDQVNECYELILELSIDLFESLSHGHKRKKFSVPVSPNGVIDASFSFDSSNDMWGVASSVYSSAERWLKRRRFQDQLIYLPLPSVSSAGVLDGPY